MKIIETLYNQENVRRTLENIKDPTLFLDAFGYFLENIKQIPEVNTEENLKGREQYLSDQTVAIFLGILDVFGDRYPDDVIRLLAEQEYSIHLGIAKTVNLFEYLTNHIPSVKQNKLTILFYDACYRKCETHIYGKKVFSAMGSRGDYYLGFHNELLSKMRTDLSIAFEMHIPTRSYDMMALGRSLGVSESTLANLYNVNEKANFLYGPSDPHALLDCSHEMEFKETFQTYVDEVNDFLSKETSLEVQLVSFFDRRTDVNTDFYLSIRKSVSAEDYPTLQQSLMNTIKQFNAIEDTYFSYEHMKEPLRKLRRERRKHASSQPLFG